MFALSFLFAALTALSMPADGAYTYVVNVSGSPIGKTAITLKHVTPGVQVNESANAVFGGSQFAGTATLSLDSSLVPTAYTAVYNGPGRVVHAALAFTPKGASETSDSGNTTFSLGAESKHFVVLDGTLFAGFFILPAQLQAWSAQPVTAVSAMFGRQSEISADSTLRPDRPKDVPPGDRAYSVSDPIQFTLWYDPATLLVDELDVPQQAAAFIRQR